MRRKLISVIVRKREKKKQSPAVIKLKHGCYGSAHSHSKKPIYFLLRRRPDQSYYRKIDENSISFRPRSSASKQMSRSVR